MLTRGDLVPHFTVIAADGRRIPYADIWQRQPLVLLVAPPGDDGVVEQLADRAAALDAVDAAVVVTADPVAGVQPPAVIVADRWGEIAFSAHAPAAAGLPDADEILEWLRFVEMKCPECEGETR